MRDIINGFLHFMVSAALCLLFVSLPPLITACLFAAFIGIAKEGWDYYNPPHCCDIWDMILDFAGILFFVMVWMACT